MDLMEKRRLNLERKVTLEKRMLKTLRNFVLVGYTGLSITSGIYSSSEFKWGHKSLEPYLFAGLSLVCTMNARKFYREEFTEKNKQNNYLENNF